MILIGTGITGGETVRENILLKFAIYFVMPMLGSLVGTLIALTIHFLDRRSDT